MVPYSLSKMVYILARITRWEIAIACLFQSCPTNNHRKSTHLAQKNNPHWLLTVQRKVLWEVRLFITKGHFLKYLQILVKSSHKRIRMKNTIGIQSPEELLCKDRGFTDFWQKTGLPPRHWRKGNLDRREPRWNSVKQEVIYQVPQGRGGLKIRNCCTFRASLNIRRASQPDEGSLQETKCSKGVRESQPLGLWASKGDIRSTGRDCSGSWWLLTDCPVVSSTGKANEEPGGQDEGACYLCIVGGWVASALNWHRDRQDKGARVSNSSWKLRRTGPLLHCGGGVNWSIHRGEHWTGPIETTEESEENVTSCPFLSYASLFWLWQHLWCSSHHPTWSQHPPLVTHPAPIPAHGLLKWLSGKETACQCRRHWGSGFNRWVGKIPWGRTSDPIQDSCLENPTDRGWRTMQQWRRLGRSLTSTSAEKQNL